MPRRPRSRAATCSRFLALPLAAASCCACASAWAVSYPSAANWSLPRPAGTLPRCSFPSRAAAEPAQQLRTLCVVGERHSGTNFVSALLDLNFAFEDDADASTGDDSRPPLQAHQRLIDPLGRVPPRPGRVGHGCTAHKHTAQPARGAAACVAPGFAAPDETAFLAVLVVRNPLDWARGMHGAPWETALGDVSVDSAAAFLSRPWPRGVDLHSAEAHAHALAMRAAKHAAWRLLPWPHAETVQYECLVAGAGAGALDWLSSLEARYALRRSAAAAAGWQLPATRVGGRAAFEADSLTDAGDADAAALVPQQDADYAAMERAAFPARAEQALLQPGSPPTAELARAVVQRADGAVEAALGYAHVLGLAARLAARAQQQQQRTEL